MSAAAALAFLAAALAATGCGLLVEPIAWRGRGTEPDGRGRGVGGERGAWGEGGDRLGAAGRSPRILRILIRTGRRLRPGVAVPGDLEARIALAGRPAGLGPRELMAAKMAAAVGGGLVATLLSTAAPGRLGLALVVAGPVGGFLAPDLWLMRRARERARRVRRQLPALLDLLRVSVEAGRSLPSALRDVGERTRGPLAAEWLTVGREVALGVPLDQALAAMAERAPLAEVKALVAALDRARRHGAPLADTLAAQACDARFAIARAAREEAARAGPKIQLVVALLLVPSVLLLVAAALVAALLGSGGDGPPVLPI